MKTTLNKIRSHSPCEPGWRILLEHLGKTKADDAPLSLLTILDNNGIEDALWCLRAVTGYQAKFRRYAIWCAMRVRHLLIDKRAIDVLNIAEKYYESKDNDAIRSLSLIWPGYENFYITSKTAAAERVVLRALDGDCAAEAVYEASIELYWAVIGAETDTVNKNNAIASMKKVQEIELRRILSEIKK